jgi:hypothetical protein
VAKVDNGVMVCYWTFTHWHGRHDHILFPDVGILTWSDSNESLCCSNPRVRQRMQGFEHHVMKVSRYIWMGVPVFVSQMSVEGDTLTG